MRSVRHEPSRNRENVVFTGKIHGKCARPRTCPELPTHCPLSIHMGLQLMGITSHELCDQSGTSRVGTVRTSFSPGKYTGNALGLELAQNCPLTVRSVSIWAFN